ncbi:MAG: chorismate mutase [Candidatus Micrarchaeota archaeon]|nr:chorismate mutase [Candidatus Micrarchaeota archaeon]
MYTIFVTSIISFWEKYINPFFVIRFGGSDAVPIRELRKKIDEIDSQIVLLLSKRFELGKRIGRIKRSAGLPIQDRSREAEVINRVRTLSTRSGAEPDAIEDIYRVIIKWTKKLE